MLRSKWFWVIVVLVVIGGVWWSRRDTAPTVHAFVVERGDVVATVSVSGSVEPVTAADLAFEGVGTVAWVGAAVGDRVRKGQVLVRLDRARLWSDYQAAREAVRQAEASERLARRKWRHLKPEERERVKSVSAQARAQLAAASAVLTKTAVVAPFDGIVTRQEAHVGERTPASGTLVRVIADDAFELKVLVPEADIHAFRVGTEGAATFDALGPERTLDVTVQRIEPEATVIQDVVYYAVYFRAPALSRGGAWIADIRSGMSVDVDVVTAQRKGVVRVPRRLVSQDDEGFFVMMAPPEGSADAPERRSITLGVQGDDGFVEVTQGLAAGDSVVEPQTK